MRTYLIVGGSSGIGKEIVDDLSQNGDRVIATFCTHEKSSNGNVEYRYLNVTDGAIELDQFPESIDGLVYCPGTINLKPFNRFSPADFLEDYELQVLGAIKVIQFALPALRNGDSPSILLFSTVAVQKGFNFHAQVSTSKGALEGLVRSLAAEFAPNIRVNAIAPGLTDTPLAARLLSTEKKRASLNEMNPMGRVGHVSDISGLATYLLSEKSGWITGQILHMDGGMSAIN